ncbi:hypothetical protein BBR47_31750 [Brevibacillus brevis NBRC 100599]|uniref:Uncharacterized protein n=1 Tax=Brevibacillus brevis (strain 47 / JCM 6285 / NBRC 100599) TaxID=358681 RepID=C0ZEE3_BREBN|nr:hypothetical protein BBR47_31750 [Brevibacillus brevis NBRC 100599]
MEEEPCVAKLGNTDEVLEFPSLSHGIYFAGSTRFPTE